VTGGEHDGTSGQSQQQSDNEIRVPPIGNGDVYNDGEILTAGDAGVVGVGASGAPALGRLLPLFGAAILTAGVVACGVLDAWA